MPTRYLPKYQRELGGQVVDRPKAWYLQRPSVVLNHGGRLTCLYVRGLRSRDVQKDVLYCFPVIILEQL